MSVNVFFGIAVLSVIGRTITRIYTRRRLALDDYLILFATICLGASIGLVHVFLPSLFLGRALSTDPIVVIPPDFLATLPKMISLTYSFLCLIWTVIFAVKFSFLALFRLLIQRLPMPIIRYFWITVGVTVASWIFVVVEPFVFCAGQSQ